MVQSAAHGQEPESQNPVEHQQAQQPQVHRFGVNGAEDFKVGEFGENVPESDYQTKRDPFLDNPTERGPEPSSDMLAQVETTASELEGRGEFVLAREIRSAFSA